MAEPASFDRRHRRRQETIEEVLDHAVAIMASEGVAGLSLGEIARRMGIRPPSLYVYFPSKHALYDALFRRGCELLLTRPDPLVFDPDDPDVDLASVLIRGGEWMVRWSMENPAYAQLLFWRPVPGFEPSAEAYAPAIRFYEAGAAAFRALQEHGHIRADVDLDTALREWTVITAGIVSQQLSNAPDEPVEEGRFTSLLPELARMFAAHIGSGVTTKNTPTRRGHARPR